MYSGWCIADSMGDAAHGDRVERSRTCQALGWLVTSEKMDLPVLKIVALLD